MRHTISRATETEKQELPELGLVARKLREAALRRAISRAKEAEKQELSELALVAISEGHVACLRVLTDSCKEVNITIQGTLATTWTHLFFSCGIMGT